MKRRQVCNAAVAEWRAGTEKSPASKPPQKYKCDCHVCLLYLEANPPQPPKPRAKAKPFWIMQVVAINYIECCFASSRGAINKRS
jgi:hypothetical protein